MPNVTVDLDDLEKLVFGSGALKTIEGALVQRKEDPFVKPHLDFTDAHNRLAGVMRQARRNPADTVVDFNESLTDDEKYALRQVRPGFSITPEMKMPKAGEVMSVYDRLAAKGCVVMGQLLVGVLWADNPRPEVSPDPRGFAIKLTSRGVQKLRE